MNMNSATAIRRVAVGASSKRAAVCACPATRRTIATQEKDPQLGDYPQLPDRSRALLPPTGWWDNQMRRNFGEIVHEKEEIYSMWGPDPPKLPPSTALFRFGVAATVFGTIMLTACALTPEIPAVRREYPYDGLVKELGGLEENKARVEQVDAEAE